MNHDKLSEQNSVDCISLRDLSRHIALSLRGNLTPTGDIYTIEVQNKQRDKYMSLSLSGAEEGEIGCNLRVETGDISNRVVHTKLELLDIDHLYVTWGTPGQVSFCYAQDNRFTLIDVTADATVIALDGADCRQEEKVTTESEKDDNRRTFYHIGKFAVKNNE